MSMKLTRVTLMFAGFATVASALTPLTDMGSQNYLGFPGGLYPGGRNEMPLDHAAAGMSFAREIVPRDTVGVPSSSGKIVLLSVGMSNTTQEFCSQGNPTRCEVWSFVGQALADPEVNRTSLVFANGAKGGQAAETWDSAGDRNYDRIRDTVLAPRGLSEAQVQVAWVKVANPRPTRSLPDGQADAYRLVTQIGDIARALRLRYPNLKIIYLSSRIYAGYATTMLNPEPYAYESAFAVKWAVEAQIEQMRNGEVTNPRAGDLSWATAAPWMAWGPYLWADGQNPRSDGLVWEPGDFQSDGTHPAQSGEQKVGALLLRFLKSEPTARGWFRNDAPARRRPVRR
ncbi:MAG: hypothetical protein KY459_02805 [Acidobacteria bacterium]|nr:hypothetical protein [Acidobacteriota bacterium]